MIELLVSALELSAQALWLVNAIVADDKDFSIDKIVTALSVLNEIQSGADSISFSDDGVFTDRDVLKLVENKAQGKPLPFDPRNEELDSQRKLNSIKIGARCPETNDDWKLVRRVLESLNDCLPALRARGCPEEDISIQDPSRLLETVKEGQVLKKEWDAMGGSVNTDLHAIASEKISDAWVMQMECRKLSSKIQLLEADLVFEKVVASLKKILDATAMSVLVALTDDLLNHSAAVTTSAKVLGERTIRHREGFKRSFQEAAKHMPLVLMTTEQVSELLPADHSFDLGIMDETSESNCTAVNVMARSKQVLAVGDDKQVSPSQVALGEERIRWLGRLLPDIPTKRKLLPESSFFALTKSTFPLNSVALFEHFRCSPEIIAVSNSLFYTGTLLPLRLTSTTDAIEHVLVEGKRDQKKKNNSDEAETIANRIHDYIEENADEDECKTIGVVSMGGPEQCKLIKERIEEKVEHLIQDFGPEVVDRHNILVGTPQEFQGGERDIGFLSAVHSPPANGKLPVETSGAAKKSWNVALTRFKNKIILVHSYEIKNLKVNDFRQNILRMFMNKRKERKETQADWTDPLANGVKRFLSEYLKSQGYIVERQRGKVWSNALCVNSSVLVLVENGGETEDEWETAWNQQQSLESAGRSCLRVDCMAFALNRAAACQEVHEYLKRIIPTPSDELAHGSSAAGEKKRSSTEATVETTSAGSDRAKMPRRN